MDDKTVYIYTLKVCSKSNRDITEYQSKFPSNFLLEKKAADYFCKVTVNDDFQQESVDYLVLRELDRFFFLTGIKISMILNAIEYPNGKRIGMSTIDGKITIVDYSKLAKSTQQNWTGPLAIQLRLWRLANDSNTPLGAKINLLFQIIEAKYPDTRNSVHYPKYNTTTSSPDPKTECKLLRDYVSHQQENVCAPQLKNYCEFLGYPDSFYDPTDSALNDILGEKLRIIEVEAKKVIDDAISYEG